MNRPTSETETTEPTPEKSAPQPTGKRYDSVKELCDGIGIAPPTPSDAAREAARQVNARLSAHYVDIAAIIQRAIDAATAEMREQLKDAGQRGARLALDAYKSDLAAKDREIAELRVELNAADEVKARLGELTRFVSEECPESVAGFYATESAQRIIRQLRAEVERLTKKLPEDVANAFQHGREFEHASATEAEAECARWQKIAETASAEREHNANVAAEMRALADKLAEALRNIEIKLTILVAQYEDPSENADVKEARAALADYDASKKGPTT